MSENLDDLSPNTLDNISPSIRESEPLSPRSIINQIARNLAESTQTLNSPIPSILSPQQSFTINANSEASSQHTSSERPRNSQCIDLTKEQDDVMIITDSQSTASRRHSRRTNPSRAISNNSGDDIEIISTQRRLSRRRMRNPNETIVIDDDRNEASGEQSTINSSTRSTETELFSPSKRQKISDSSSLNTDSDDEILGIPKCPLCLENLNELKQRNKKLVATPCGHVLCNKCLDEYLKSGGPQNKAVLCPTCRTKITKSKIITLFL